MQFGGKDGQTIKLRAADMIVIPAGTGHCALAKSDSLLVVGAYPPHGRYDEPKPEDIDPCKARAPIAEVPAPNRDPISGADGPLREIWLRRRTHAEPGIPG